MCRASREWLCNVVLWSPDVQKENLEKLAEAVGPRRKGFMEQLADNIEAELLEHFRKENELLIKQLKEGPWLGSI